MTDNAANMNKMRSELKAVDDTSNVITYGYGAHLLNLLVHDVEIVGVKEPIVQVMKNFSNNHFAHTQYKSLILPK